MSTLMVAVAAGCGQYKTRTSGDAHLYRITQYYDSWPFEPDSRVPRGSNRRKRTETFRTLEPVMQRLARANGYAQYQRRNGADWSAFVAVAEQLTDDGWQPLDLDFPPPRPRARAQRALGPVPPLRPGRNTAMAVVESADYQAARERITGNPIIAMMAAGVVTVPLAELAHEDGTPRSGFMNQANRTFDDAEARNAGNPSYQPYPPGAHRHLGLIAEAVLAERAAMRAAVASAMAAPGTDPESTDVTRIIERMRAGEAPVEIARQTGAIAPGE